MVRQIVLDEPPKQDCKYWKPQIGDSIEGKLLKIVEGRYGKQYVLRKPDNTDIVLPNDTNLMQKLEKLWLNDYVWISMIGTKDTGHQKPMKVYKVEHDPEYKPAHIQHVPTPGSTR